MLKPERMNIKIKHHTADRKQSARGQSRRTTQHSWSSRGNSALISQPHSVGLAACPAPDWGVGLLRRPDLSLDVLCHRRESLGLSTLNRAFRRQNPQLCQTERFHARLRPAWDEIFWLPAPQIAERSSYMGKLNRGGLGKPTHRGGRIPSAG